MLDVEERESCFPSGLPGWKDETEQADWAILQGEIKIQKAYRHLLRIASEFLHILGGFQH